MAKESLHEIEHPPITETAILVRLVLPGDAQDDVDESLEEMRRLAWTAGAVVACTLVQRREKPCPATLIGAGKLEQLRAACEEHEADLVLFDTDLSPTQGVKLQEALALKVLDRTQLILDIFAQRARTNEGKHQVELAQLEYRLPRLVGSGSAMMRQQGGIGVRGPGEQKLEVDRRVIRRRIGRLKEDIEAIRNHRRIQRKRRQQGGVASAALVGYTNAGKSSLLNALTGAGTFVEDKLFATLDPLSRRCRLPSRREVVLTDTVGFIRKLPHSLVAAFRATLEEVNESDILLLVADAAHPAVAEHIVAVYDVLNEIRVPPRPIIAVFNKCDIADPGLVRQLMERSQPAVAVSARTGEGLPALLELIEAHLASSRRLVTLRIPQREAGLVARLRQAARVLRQAYDDDAILLEVEADGELPAPMNAYVIESVEPAPSLHGGASG